MKVRVVMTNGYIDETGVDDDGYLDLCVTATAS